MTTRTVYINTDAGYKNKKGAYAFWIHTPDGVFIKSGKINVCIKNSTQAEALSVMYALSNFLNEVNTKDIDNMVIYTDSLNLIHFFSFDKYKLEEFKLFDKFVYNLARKFENTRKKLSFTIEIKHIKAHDMITSKTSWINDFLDKECKRLLKTV